MIVMASKTILSVLVAARKLISNPKKWNQEWLALDRERNHVDCESRDAVSFCALGAITRYAHGQDELIEGCRDLLLDKNTSFSQFNDTRPHKEVIADFDKAIARLKAAS